MKLKFFISSFSILFVCLQVSAQQEEPEAPSQSPPLTNLTNQRGLGDQIFSIAGGINIPLSTIILNDNPITGQLAGIADTKLQLGGGGALKYGLYVSPNIKLTLRFSANFMQDINDNWLYLIPVVLRGAYRFRLSGRFSIPVHIGLGVSFTTWKTNFLVDPTLTTGFGLYFDWSSDWSFGIDMSYLLIAELSSNKREDHALGNFLEIFLAAEYHF